MVVLVLALAALATWVSLTGSGKHAPVYPPSNNHRSGLQPDGDGLQPTSDGLQPNGDWGELGELHFPCLLERLALSVAQISPPSR